MSTIDFTNITDILNSVTTIFPAILNLVVAIVPVMMVLTVVGFVMYFFDDIIDMIRNVSRFGKA